jgi:hypothetical protein
MALDDASGTNWLPPPADGSRTELEHGGGTGWLAPVPGGSFELPARARGVNVHTP